MNNRRTRSVAHRETAPTDPTRWLERFSRLRITVWGDFVADEFVSGEITRVSREAPVLILKHLERKFAPGGGANAAANLAALGVRVSVVGAVGRDEAGANLRRAFEAQGMDTSGLLAPPRYVTPTKTRILAHHAHTAPQQVVRLDREPAPLDSRTRERLVRIVHKQMARRSKDDETAPPAILISDYGYGAVAPEQIAALRKQWQDGLISVDARYQIGSYRGLSAATPNEAELEAAMGVTIGSDMAQLNRAGRRLRARLDCKHLLVTRGRDGMALFEAGQPMRCLPVHGSDQALDVTGAGDTVIAVFTAALAAGADGLAAARIANVAGGLVVMKRGTAAVSPAELRAGLAD